MQLEPRLQIGNCDSGKEMPEKKSISPKALQLLHQQVFADCEHPKVLLQRPGQSSRMTAWLGVEKTTLPQLPRVRGDNSMAVPGGVRAAGAQKPGKRNLLFELWLRPARERLKKAEGKMILNNYGLYLCNIFINKGAEVSSQNLRAVTSTFLCWYELSSDCTLVRNDISHYRKVFYCFCTGFLIVNDELPDVKWFLKGTDKTIFSYKINYHFVKKEDIYYIGKTPKHYSYTTTGCKS